MSRGRLYDGGLNTLLARLQAAVADHYSVACEIGRGGMATVYLGDDLKHARQVAIKLLHPQLATGLGAERFLREIKTAAGLTHPHIVPLFDSDARDGLLFYVMPYIDGETLRDRLTRQGSLPIEDAVRIACEVLEALGYAHAHGVVHRDIKPENIIFSAGRALVTDFGIARAVSAASLEALTIDGAVGTPAYMSPEQASQSPQLDGRSDIYSLGCTLYEMLTGSVPFPGPTAQAGLARHRLEGSVRRAGNRLRISAQLVKVADGYHLWSERYDREMTDVFAIQDEIAKAIANRLRVTLGDDGAPLVAPGTGNLDAYHLYLKGRYYLAQRGLGLKRALDCFHQALTLDPSYALAHAGLADACTVLAQYGLAPPNVLRPKARAAVQRARELAPELAEVHCAAGALSLICDWDWAAAARDLRRAVQLNPRSVTARQWLSYYLVFIEGRFDEGLAQARRAVELDPLAPLLVMQLGMALMGAGCYDEAAAPLRRAAELAPLVFP